MADYSTLRLQILDEIKKDTSPSVRTLSTKIKNNTATYDDAVKFSKALGDATSKALEKYSGAVVDEALAEYAEVVLAPIYRSMQSTGLEASKLIQQIYNDKAGFGFAPVNVARDESRIVHMVSRFREATSFDEVAFLLGKDVSQNIARASVTDTMRSNANFMSNAGIEVTYTRIGTDCCPWCAEVSGTYTRDELPDDYWKVHKDCTCVFEYKARNTHTRTTFSTGSDGKITKNTTNI